MTRQTIFDLEPHWANNRRFWTGWASAAPDSDFPLYRSDIPYPLFNGVMRIRNIPLDEAVAVAKLKLAGAPWIWCVGGDSDAGVAEDLLARGASEGSTLPVMAADLTKPLPPSLIEALTIHQVTSRPGMQEFVSAYAAPLGFPQFEVNSMVDRELEYLSRDPEIIRLAGVVDGRTVGTAEVSLGGEIAGLYTVATADGYRRRGIATALSLEALRIARGAGQCGRHAAGQLGGPCRLRTDRVPDRRALPHLHLQFRRGCIGRTRRRTTH